MNPIMTFINNFQHFLGTTVSNMIPRHTNFVSGGMSFLSLRVRCAANPRECPKVPEFLRAKQNTKNHEYNSVEHCNHVYS